MCGLAGYVSKNRIDNSVLDEMMEVILHRGPDAEGKYYKCLNNWEIGIGHRRLAIIDLSERATQPMTSKDGSAVISYNGEIYNFKQIKSELEKQGYLFVSESDTEVLLQAYVEWGTEAFKKLNGMFAVAILDNHKKRLILARDRFGEKPLYYRVVENDGIYFASDLNSLKAIPDLEWHINRQALATYLWKMYIAAPETIYEGCYKLMPGTFLTFDLDNGGYCIERYWDMLNNYFADNVMVKDEDEYLEILHIKLRESVKHRMISDVPVGIFLSSGYDSSLVAALAQSVNNKQIDTFSIGFYEERFDEAKQARNIAQILGTNHHELYFSIEDAKNMVEIIPKAYTEPFADNSQLPMLLLSKFTKKEVTVALSGDGADELFLGYPSSLQLQKYNRYKFPAYIMSKIDIYNSDKRYDYRYWLWNKAVQMRDKEHLLNMEYEVALHIIEPLIKDKDFTAIPLHAYDCSNIKIDDLIKANEYLGLAVGLSDDMLHKVDRASMWFSLECRAPFLDNDVVEIAFNMPVKYKISGGKTKVPIRELVYKYLPKELMDRPKKGFGVPINKWLHEGFEDLISSYLEEGFIKRQNLFDCQEVQRLYFNFKTQSNPVLDRIMWCFLVFQMWYVENYENA